MIIPDALLPILNLPEFRMFMAICPTKKNICKNSSRMRHNLFKPYLETTSYFSNYVLHRDWDVIKGDLTG